VAVDVGAALAGYTELFTMLCFTGLGAASALLLVTPVLKKMMHGVH
jgi:POT family proton-dependent oligopeptide transporter